MRRFALIVAVTTCLFRVTVSFGGDAELLFEAGNRAYLDGNWSEAGSKWEQIQEMGYAGGALYFNLGNAYFKQGKMGRAILYWEKAAKIMGEDGDIAANLKIARARLEDRLENPVRLPVWDWFDDLRDRLPAGLLTTLAIVLSFATFGLLGLRKWLFRNGKAADLSRNTAVLTAILLVLDLGMISMKAYNESANRMGVFIASEAEVLSAPALGSGKLLFTLHEGSKVSVIRTLEGWVEISAGKDKQGWVQAETLGII